MAHKAQFTGRIALAVEPFISIGGGLVCVVAAALTSEVASIMVATVFAREALVTGPGLSKDLGRGIAAAC